MTRRYPPSRPLSHLETRATVVELKPVFFSIVEYGTFLESISAVWNRLENSSISSGVSKSRKKRRASSGVFNDKRARINCLFLRLSQYMRLLYSRGVK